MTDHDFDNYCQKLMTKFKQEPDWKLRQEFGKMLMSNIDNFSDAELKRYKVLKQLLFKEEQQ